MRLAFRCMSTEIVLQLKEHPPAVAARDALARAKVALLIAEAELSRFRPTSGLRRLNAAAGSGPHPVSPLLLAVVESALRAAAETGGLFDPTLLPALKEAGYDRSFETLPTADVSWWRGAPSRPGAATRRCQLPDIRLDPIARTVALPAHVQIDLGGIAKSWLADHTAETLSAEGPGLVDLGGDIRACGDETWRVGLMHDRPAGVVALRGNAVATSSICRRAWRIPGGVAHHIIDPRTGKPAESDLHTVSVIAPTAVEAETAARCILILGSASAAAWLESRGLEGILSRRDGALVHITPGTIQERTRALCEDHA